MMRPGIALVAVTFSLGPLLIPPAIVADVPVPELPEISAAAWSGLSSSGSWAPAGKADARNRPSRVMKGLRCLMDLFLMSLLSSQGIPAGRIQL